MTAAVVTDEELDALVGKAVEQLLPAQRALYRRLVREYLASPYATRRNTPLDDQREEDVATACGIYDHLMTATSATQVRERLIDDETSLALIALTDERRKAQERLTNAIRDLYQHEDRTISSIARSTGLAHETVASRVADLMPGDDRREAERHRPDYLAAIAHDARQAKDKLNAQIRGALLAGRPLKRIHRETGLALATLRNLRDEVIPPQ